MTLVLSSGIFGPAFQDPSVVALLDDAAYFRAMLDVEVALSRVQSRLGIIPAEAALGIEAAASALTLDAALLSAGVLRDGVPTIALVSQLRAAAPAGARPFVHWGATSQDIMDSATVLCMSRVLGHMQSASIELLRTLAALTAQHRESVMAARTHGQHALPTSFALKVAGWALPLVRQHERLCQLRPRLCVVQLGGAAGTLAALGPRALELEQALAAELGLGVADLPWHTQRDAIGELGSWLSLSCGVLGKMAQDVLLLCQTEVSELSEAPHGERGGSSSMPQKNNPMRSEQILAAARSTTGHLSALLNAMVQEHERGTHGWQVEWLSLSPMLMLAAGALHNARLLTRELQVYPERMRQNLLAQHGLSLAEAAVGALCSEMHRPEAQALVARGATQALQQRRFLIDVLRESAAEALPGNGVDWSRLARPEDQLGQANALVDRVLRRVAALTGDEHGL
jgi:3-carboxy-cis,cis-muconate cycloisomerase